MSRRVHNLLWFLAYLAVIAMVVVLLVRGRNRLLPQLAQPDARADWQSWRDDVKNSQDTGPVRRRVPKSSEPPLLVLLRDYFGTCLTAAIFFTSLLFAVTMIFVRGAVSAGEPPNSSDALPSSRAPP